MKNPELYERISVIFDKARFVEYLGFKFVDCGEGWVETTLEVEPHHFQMNDFVHAGVQATIADHTSGAAAFTMCKPDEYVLTIEFKINLLRPALAQQLRCRAQVLRAGRTVIVAESEVFAINEGVEKLCSKAMVTLAVVKTAEGV